MDRCVISVVEQAHRSSASNACGRREERIAPVAHREQVNERHGDAE